MESSKTLLPASTKVLFLGHNQTPVKSRWYLALHYWWLWLPFPLILLETLCQHLYPFASPYLGILVAQQPIAVTLTIALSLFRTALGYLLLTTFLALLVPRTTLSLSLFCLSYGISGLTGIFPSGTLPKAFFATFLVLGIFALVTRSKPEPKRRPLPLTTLLGCLFFLWLSKIETKTQGPHSPSHADSKLPSFLLLSFDSLPADYFHFQNGPKIAAPIWHRRWLSQSDNFSRAYTVTNSTFTSWYSILSGKFPHETNVSSLYPNPREGHSDTQELLPQKLKKAGYHTVFLTDCATTSNLKLSYGFDELYQTDIGGLHSAQSLIASSHPGLGIFTKIPLMASLFPELQTYGSRMYQPEAFSLTAKQLIRKLQKNRSPYFLAIHSCVTHRDVTKHRPTESSPMLEDLPESDSPQITELFMSLRMADKMADEIFSEGLRENTWGFLFSDHGVRVEKKKGGYLPFSHALGLPVNRYQYQVPLYVVRPGVRKPQNWQHVVSLLDLYPTLLKLAGISSTSSGKQLWDTTHRILALNSAVPDADPEHPDRLFALLKEGTFTKKGEFFFSSNYLPQQISLGILDYPWRLVKDQKNIFLFNETVDPENQTDLKLRYPKTERKLRLKLCGISPNLCDSKKIQIASSRRTH